MALARARRPKTRPQLLAAGVGARAPEDMSRAVVGAEAAIRDAQAIARTALDLADRDIPGVFVIDPRDFGGRFTGSSDDTEAIQRAINAALVESQGIDVGRVVMLPAGDVNLSDTLLIRSAVGVSVIGQGQVATNIKWRGNASSPMFKLDGANNCCLREFRVQVPNGYTLATCVEIGIDQGEGTQTRNSIQRVSILGSGRMGIGVWFRLYDAGNDVKNDYNIIQESLIQGYTDTGIIIDGYNAKKNLFIHTQVRGNPDGLYGIDTARVPGQGGSFVMIGGQCSDNTEYDYRLGKPNDAIYVEGCYSSNSARWFTILNDDGGVQPTLAWPVAFVGHTWSSASTKIAADAVIVDIKTPGPVSIRDCKLGGNFGGGQMRFRYKPQHQAGYATDLLTMPVNPLEGETVTIGGVVYTFVATLANPYDVKIGGGTNASLKNLDDAVNGQEGDEGVTFGEGTAPNPFASGQREDATTFSVRAAVAGTAGNSIAVSTTVTGASWATGTLTGGLDDQWENVRGSFAFENTLLLSTQDDDDIFTELPPDSVSGSLHYDIAGDIRPIIYGDGAPFDSGFFVPRRDQDWAEYNMPVPRIWCDAAQATGQGNALVLDLQRRRSTLDLASANKAVGQFQQTVGAFDGQVITMGGGAGEGHGIDTTTEVDPSTMNVAMGVHGVFAAPAAADRVLCIGSGTSGAGQGPWVGMRPGGLIRLAANGNNADGAVNHADGNPHTIICVIDRGGNGLPQRLFVVTDLEVIDYVAAFGFPGALANFPNKGVGNPTTAPNNGWAGSWRLFFCWTGADVRRIRADGAPGAWDPTDIIPLLRGP